MSVGGLAVTPSRASQIVSELADIKRSCGLAENAEVKWSRCKKRRKNAHVRFVHYLFDAIGNGHLHFHVRFSPFKNYDHSVSGKRKETDTISKAFYQLILHRPGRYYGNNRRLLVRPDDGECTAYLPSIIDGLNSDICETFGHAVRPIADIAPRNSKKEPMLQLLDVTLGALTAVRNGNHENGTLSDHKVEVVKAALDLGRIRDIEKSDPIERRDFNVWNVVPKWTKGAIPVR